MGLHWAWGFGIGGSTQNYADSGFVLTGIANYSSTPLPRHPAVGYGGMIYGHRMSNNNYIRTPIFPKGVLSDGQVQFHFYATTFGTAGRIRLLSASDIILLELRCASGGASTLLNVYSGEGSLSLRGTTTSTLNQDTWHVIGIRFQPGSSGDIAISIDGQTDIIVASGTTGATSDWGKLEVVTSASGGQWYVTGITVWDDGAGDDALTLTRWIPALKPISDASIGSWTDEAAGTTDIFQSVDEDTISTTDYCTTTTDPDEIRFGVDTDNINASWTPNTIDGVMVIASVRGDGVLNTAQPVIDDSSNNLLGTSQTTDADTSLGVNDIFPLQADASTAWSKTAVNSHSYGIKVS